MNKKNIRTNIWKKLQKVAKPDSRFHFNFEEYIPDFIESENAHKQIYEDQIYKDSKFIFITPDNCLEKIREQSLLDKKTIIVSTYGIYRGFESL